MSHLAAGLVRKGFLLLGLAAVSCSPSHHFVVMRGPQSTGTILPLTFVYNLPVTGAEADGVPLKLILDIGGHDTLTLKPGAMRRLASLETTGRRAFSVDAAGRLMLSREFRLPRLRVGEVVLAEVEGHQFDHDIPPELLARIDGYLGAAVLTRFGLLVDYPSRIVLHPAGAVPAGVGGPGWVSIPLDRRLRSPARLAGRPVTAGWDTGASHTIVAPELARELGAENGRLTTQLHLGGHNLGTVKMRTYSLDGPGVDVLIGHNLFSRHLVFFDFAGGRVLLRPRVRER